MENFDKDIYKKMKDLDKDIYEAEQKQGEFPQGNIDFLREYDFPFGTVLRNRIAEIAERPDKEDYEKNWSKEGKDSYRVYMGRMYTENEILAEALVKVIDVLYAHNLITKDDDTEGSLFVGDV